MFIPFYVKAKKFFIDNIKVNQIFECEDKIIVTRQNEEHSNDQNTLKNPNTGTCTPVIVLTVILIVCSITYMAFGKKKNYIL